MTTETSPPKWWIDRFWSKARREGNCLIWQHGKSDRGYGVVCTKTWPREAKQAYTHRLAYRLTYGPIPDGMLVCHTCDTPSCIEPAHLFLGTHGDNMQDCLAKGRHHRAPRKIQDEAIEEMRRLYTAGGVTFYDLGEQFGISYQHAHALVRGHRKAASA